MHWFPVFHSHSGCAFFFVFCQWGMFLVDNKNLDLGDFLWVCIGCMCVYMFTYAHMWRSEVNAMYFFDYSSLLYVSQGVSLNLELTDSAVLPGRQAPEILLSLSPWFCTTSSRTLKYLGLLFPWVLALLSLLSPVSVGGSVCFFLTKFLSYFQSCSCFILAQPQLLLSVSFVLLMKPSHLSFDLCDICSLLPPCGL